MIHYGSRYDYVVSRKGKVVNVGNDFDNLNQNEIDPIMSHSVIYYNDPLLDSMVNNYLIKEGIIDEDDSILVYPKDIRDLPCSMNLYDYNTLIYLHDNPFSFSILASKMLNADNRFQLFEYTDEKDGFLFSTNTHVYLYVPKMEKFFYLRKDEDKEFTDFFINMSLNLRKNTLLTILAYIYLKNTNDDFKLYRHFTIPKKNGKRRDIYAINDDLKPFLKYMSYDLYNRLEDKISCNKFVSDDGTMMGYMRGKSIIDNAKYHKNNDKVIKYDIYHMFDNINLDYFNKIKQHAKTLYGMQYDLIDMKISAYSYRLGIMFADKNNEIPKFSKNYLEEIFINPKTNGLYMGNPCSPVMANIIMLPLFNYIRHIVNKKGISCTIYADDLTFSGHIDNEYLNVKKLNSVINYCLKKFNDVKWNPYQRIKINTAKTHVMRYQRRRITGVRINHNNQTTSGQRAYRKLRSILFNIRKKGKFNIEDTEYDNVYQLLGNIEFWKNEEESDRIDKLLNVKYKNEYQMILDSRKGA